MHVQGIIDSTLREGGQTPGVNFDFQQKSAIVRGLCELGIDEIELGVASPGNARLSLLVHEARRIVGQDRGLSIWCRCKPEDIDFAAQCGVNILSLSLPVSDLHIYHKMRRDREWVIRALTRSVRYAGEKGFQRISVGFEDATRADQGFLLQCAAIAETAGAARIRLADTVGIATPGDISTLVRQVRGRCSLPVGIHTHNDFGMATANTVAAIESGASWADATVLGLGERSGNCRLEELVGYLSLVGGDRRYNPDRLPELCSLVAGAAGMKVSGRHPIVGEDIFTCETGLHVHGLIEQPETYEPFNPKRIGRDRLLRFGVKSGKKAVLNGLASMGLRISDHEAAYLVSRLKRFSAQNNESLNSRELLHFALESGVGNQRLGKVV